MNDNPLAHRWNARFAGKHPSGQLPAEVLAWHSHLLPDHGLCLDLASGLGGNAIALARHGLATEAWDISDQAVSALNLYSSSQGLGLLASVRDVEASPPEPMGFDVITVSRYLHRPLCPHLMWALRPGGLLFYQTFCRQKVRGMGPSSPEFLLEDGELLQLFQPLQVLVYREERDAGDHALGLRDQAMLVARKLA